MNIDNKVKSLTNEEIVFMINVDSIIGNLGPFHLQESINAISKALSILQTDHLVCNIANIATVTNTILKPLNINLSHAEAICILHYLQENHGTVSMYFEPNEMPIWSINV